MYIGTHACLPIVVISSIDIIRLSFSRERLLTNKQLALIGLAGVLPDFLWPHFSMQQRLHSWTHAQWFLILLFPIILLISKKRVKNQFVKFSLIFWITVILHLFMDALSGGINFFYPLGNIIGGYYISHPTWITWDIVFISATILLLFFRFKIQTRIMYNY